MDFESLRTLRGEQDGRTFVRQLGQDVALFGDRRLEQTVRELVPDLADGDPDYTRWFFQDFARGLTEAQ